MLERLTADDFIPHRGSRFRLTPADRPSFDVELIEVSESETAGPTRRQFSLVFRGGPTPPLPQQIFRVEQDEFGALDLFLVPLGPDEGGQRYEAVFT